MPAPASDHHGKAGQPPRHGHDMYSTPEEATIALLGVETWPRWIWEPADGLGAITSVLRMTGHEVFTSDFNFHPDRNNPLDSVSSFFDHKEPPGVVTAMITNPPYSLLDDWLAHASAIGLRKWAILMPLTALAGVGRFSRVFMEHPPTRIHVFADRLKFRRHGFEGKLSPMGMHCWGVWHGHTRGRRIDTIVRWLHTKQNPSIDDLRWSGGLRQW